ncbi:MAG: permease prefix domain 1-containing protein [Anaerolineae bacterium]|nr:permease prefix domain 1-containing protein [Anaerolineae bacterium]
MNDELERYLSEIASQLNVDPGQGREILNEIRSHLTEAVAEGLAEGLGPEDSLALAIEEFGEAREIGRMLGRRHSDSANQAVLAAFLPVCLAITFKWLLLPLLRDVAHWQASPTPVIFSCLALLALLVPGLTFKSWRYGYGVWAFFSLVTIAQL